MKEQLTQGAWTFAGNSAGNIMVEYALLMALIVGGVALGVDLITTATNSGFSDSASALGMNSGRLPEKTATPKLAAGRPTSTSDWPNAVELTGRTLLPLLGGVLLLGLLRGQRRIAQRKRQLDGAVPTVPELDDLPNTFAKRDTIHNRLSKNLRSIIVGSMEVRHLMTSELVTVRPSDPIDAVTAAMKKNRVRHVLVCENGNLLGLISDRDLAQSSGRSAAALMTEKPVSVEPSTAVIPAITLMIQRQISALPVVAEDKLVGLLTSTDLMLALQCTMQMMQRMQSEYELHCRTS